MPTNNTVYVDSPISDEVRRHRLYDGQLFIFTPTAQTRALQEFAVSMIEEAFAPHDPVTAQYDLPVERWVEIFGPLKPRFIHHPETRRLLRDVMTDLGCDLDDLHLDVPRLRGVTSDNYLTAGVGYAHPMHRDTWWSAPLAQLNWWMPLYPFESESAMAFHPPYWDTGVVNHSEEFNYYEWNAVGRAEAAKHITQDTRKQPHPPEDLHRDPQIRFVVPPGGLVVFSGAQLHSTVPNTSGRSRFSIDFRTVSLSDLRAGLSAPNVDSHPLGTSLRDFRRASDDAEMPADVVAQYDSGEIPDGAVLVFAPDIERTGAP
jgi:hypothetical protein